MTPLWIVLALMVCVAAYQLWQHFGGRLRVGPCKSAVPEVSRYARAAKQGTYRLSARSATV